MPTPTEQEPLMKKSRVNETTDLSYLLGNENELLGYGGNLMKQEPTISAFPPSGKLSYPFGGITPAQSFPVAAANVLPTFGSMTMQHYQFNFGKEHYRTLSPETCDTTPNSPAFGKSPFSNRNLVSPIQDMNSRCSSPSFSSHQKAELELQKSMAAQPDRDAHYNLIRSVNFNGNMSALATMKRHLNTIKHWQNLEDQFMLMPNLLRNHPDITAQSKMILCAWMVEYCCDRNFTRQTYHLAVAYLCDYLQKYETPIPMADLQDLGAIMLLRASKLQEENCIFEYQGADIHSTKVEDGYLFEAPGKVRIVTAYQWLMAYRHNWAVLNRKNTLTDVSEDCMLDTNNIERMMHTLDIMVMDNTSLRFRYSLLAAAVFKRYHSTLRNSDILAVTGYTHNQIDDALEIVFSFVSHWEIDEIPPDEVSQAYYYMQLDIPITVDHMMNVFAENQDEIVDAGDAT
ncbi:hypothetical protein BDR26DRAFT_866822 [Obelidium mucronatum]|nr:hypothetical protein BDR26DRAFT_866822 [Obelidium mucronatum]